MLPTFHSNYYFLVNIIILKILLIQNFNSGFIFENKESSTHNDTGMSNKIITKKYQSADKHK